MHARDSAPSAGKMSADERLDELARILATGLLRWKETEQKADSRRKTARNPDEEP